MLAVGKRQRTISYLRADWLGGKNGRMTLQVALERALQNFPNVDNTRLNFKGGEAEIRHRKSESKRLYLHIATWTHGESASTVPHAVAVPSADLSEEAPSEDWDYLDGDAMVMVSGNHYLIMTSGVHARSVENYIQMLLRNARKEGARLPRKIEKFELVRIADDALVQRIDNEGVKEINVNIGQFWETAEEREDSKRVTFLQRVGRSILDELITSEKTRQKIKDADNVTARLVIKIDSRRPGLRPKNLSGVSRELVSGNEDCIEIKTGRGTRIKMGELVLKKNVKVRASAKTINHKDAWGFISEYFQELETLGMTEL